MERAQAWLRSPAGHIWTDAAWVWLATRALFLTLTYLIPGLLQKGGSHSSGFLGPLNAWATQDGYHFAQIAQYGYTPIWRTAFWPLFPLSERIFGPLFGDNYGLAGMFVANVAFFGALVALRALTERELGVAAAQRTMLYIAIFPTAFYFFAPYSESLFLMLTVCSFAALRSRHWLLAGALGCLATLTRSAGVLLLAPFAIEFLLALRARKAQWFQGFSALLIPLGVGIYSLYLQLAYGQPLAFEASEQWWSRGLQPPWAIFIYAVRGVTTSHSANRITWLHTLLNLLVLVVFAVLAVLSARTLPPSFAAYALALALYFMLFPVTDPAVATQSDARYVLMMFPAFMTVAAWRKPLRLPETLLLWMPAVLAILSASFVLGLANG